MKTIMCLTEKHTQIQPGEYQMKHNVMLTIASLLSILFGTFHLADDIARGMSPGGLPNLFAVVICVVWLYGTLVLAERRSGYVIIPPRVAPVDGRPRHPHKRGGSRLRDPAAGVSSSSGHSSRWA